MLQQSYMLSIKSVVVFSSMNPVSQRAGNYDAEHLYQSKCQSHSSDNTHVVHKDTIDQLQAAPGVDGVVFKSRFATQVNLILTTRIRNTTSLEHAGLSPVSDVVHPTTL